MKAISVIALSTLAITLVCCGPKEPKLGHCSLKKVVNTLTVEEKVSLLVGSSLAETMGDSLSWKRADIIVPGAAGTTCPVSRVDIPAIVLADGPAGLRISPIREGDSATYYCTAFPSGTLLASSWDVNLVKEVGTAIGKEVLEYGVDVLLAPGMNLHRNPLCGRNFEYYSEDPLLAGKTAAAYVKGVQSNGVGATVKHFAANNQETNRHNNDARITSRALHELYLKAFEIAVKEGQPWAVMTSYNKINGVYTSECKALLTDLLRKEWDYKGLVMTDWDGGKDPVAQIKAGNDLLMPGRGWQYEALLAAIKDSSLSMDDVDASVERVLCMIERSPKGQKLLTSNAPDLKAHAALSRRAAAEGMVLLTNNNNVLPLNNRTQSVAVFGVTSYDMITGGTGSGDVNKAYAVTLADAFKQAGLVVLEAIKAPYLAYMEKATAKLTPPAFNLAPRQRLPEWLPPAKLLRQTASMVDVGIITLGRTSGEFADRRVDNDFNLSSQEQTLLKTVCAAFKEAGKPVIVVLNIGGVIETASWKELPDAILLAWQPGQEAGHAIVDVLKGKVNPSGKLPMTFPITYNEVPTAGNFPDGLTRSSAKGPQKNTDFTLYEEAIYMGYRYCNTFNKSVSFPFGHGLYYTTFRFDPPTVTPKKDGYLVKVRVTNTGQREGKAVAQLYVSSPSKSGVEKPLRELKAFQKTESIAPGESVLLSFQLPAKELAYFDETTQAWILDKGVYSFDIASSSRDVHTSALVDIDHKTWKTTARLPVSEPPLTVLSLPSTR
jgi:beta-glucosidase